MTLEGEPKTVDEIPKAEDEILIFGLTLKEANEKLRKDTEYALKQIQKLDKQQVYRGHALTGGIHGIASIELT
jgi:hypothetical protein